MPGLQFLYRHKESHLTMPFETRWFLEHKIIYVKAIGAIQDHELDDLDIQILDMLDASPYRQVHFLYDPSEQLAPPRLQALGAMKSPRHPRYGWYVQCAEQNKAVNLAGVYYSKSANLRSRMFPTLDEALAFIEEIDPEVTPLLQEAHL